MTWDLGLSKSPVVLQFQTITQRVIVCIVSQTASLRHINHRQISPVNNPNLGPFYPGLIRSECSHHSFISSQSHLLQVLVLLSYFLLVLSHKILTLSQRGSFFQISLKAIFLLSVVIYLMDSCEQ